MTHSGRCSAHGTARTTPSSHPRTPPAWNGDGHPGPAWLRTEHARAAIESARELIAGVIPAASFPERERLILVLLRDLARVALSAELEAVDAVLPPAFQIGHTIVQRVGETQRTVGSPVGDLTVRASRYVPVAGAGPELYPVFDAAGCAAGITPAMFELITNGTPAVDVPAPRPGEGVGPQLNGESGPPEARTALPPPTPAMMVEEDALLDDVASASQPPSSGRRVIAEEPARAPRELQLPAAPTHTRSVRPPASARAPRRWTWKKEQAPLAGWDSPIFRIVESEAADGRRHPRVRVELPMVAGTAHGFYCGLVSDVSAGGLFVATYRQHPVGEVIEFALRLPDSDEPLVGLAEVRWIREHNESSDTPPGMGLQFIELSADALERIRRFVATHAPLVWEE